MMSLTVTFAITGLIAGLATVVVGFSARRE